MDHIQVTCAIIERDGFVLAAQRSAVMSLPLKWELPGGKIHQEESPSECLRRELFEELNIHVSVGRSLLVSTYQYPTITVTLHPFICSIEAGEIVLNEHAAITWLAPNNLHSLDWAAADIPVIESYLVENRVDVS